MYQAPSPRTAPINVSYAMAGRVTGTGFKLYFPNAEQDTSPASAHPSTSLGQVLPRSECEDTKKPAPAPDSAHNTSGKRAERGEAITLRSPMWKKDESSAVVDSLLGPGTLGPDEGSQRKRQTSLSIPPLEDSRHLSELDQELNIKSYRDSRRRSSQCTSGSVAPVSGAP